MYNFQELKKIAKTKIVDNKSIKVALLGDSATQFLSKAIDGAGKAEELNLNIWEAEFDQLDRQILDLDSDLYKFKPEIIILSQSSQKLLKKFDKYSNEQRLELAIDRLAEIENFCNLISSNLGAKVIYLNYSEIDDAVFGSFSNKIESSFLFQLRKLNFELSNLSIKLPELFICDLSTVQNQIGRVNFFHSAMYITADMVFSIEALPFIAYKIISICSNLLGRLKKCLILDLDNTMWGGVIGDDGIENIQIGSLGIGKAFSDIQYWAKKLKERGIILAVCSKNTDAVALEPFEKHPDMILRKDDISVFVANWENKADNIRHIQQILNIGFDSMVFIDDNPFERNLVRQNLPEVVVPELPEDPAEYLEYLRTLNLFETTNYSNEDKNRTKLYQTEAKRVSSQHSFTDINEYLKNLEMTSKVEGVTKFNAPRISQLSMRSNQFNLRTVRYSDDDINRIRKDKNYSVFTFTLEDKFGDNGLIAIVILRHRSAKELFIENWLMSCRVLKRGMESFVLNSLVDFAKNNNFVTLKGEYIPTAKNKMVEFHYSNLGFKQENELFILDVQSFVKEGTFIDRK